MFAWLLVIHITGIVFWMGSLLLLTRVLAWHADQPPEVQSALPALEKKLFMGGIIPGLVLTLGAGILLLSDMNWGPLDAKVVGAGFHIKLTLVFFLVIATFVVMSKMQALAAGQGKAGTFKALHGICAALFIGVLVVYFVVRPAMAEKKAKAATEAAVQDAGE